MKQWDCSLNCQQCCWQENSGKERIIWSRVNHADKLVFKQGKPLAEAMRKLKREVGKPESNGGAK